MLLFAPAAGHAACACVCACVCWFWSTCVTLFWMLSTSCSACCVLCSAGACLGAAAIGVLGGGALQPFAAHATNVPC